MLDTGIDWIVGGFMKFGRFLRLENRVTPAALFPDLQILANYLNSWSINSIAGGGRELRYTTAVGNGGEGPFEIRGTTSIINNPDGSQSQLVNQRVYQAGGSFIDQPAGTFAYHPAHGHVHFDNFVYGQLRLRPADQSVGAIVTFGPKTSFCLIDTLRYDPSLPNSPAAKVYETCSNQVQGISVGWNDVYGSSLEGQSIDITGVPNGDYWLEVVVDPFGDIQESNESNNVTRVPITLSSQPAVGFQILSVNPAGAVNDAIGSVTVNFNQPVNASTFTAADVAMNGPAGKIAVASVTALSTVQFRIDFTGANQVGTYNLAIGPNITSAKGSLLDQNNNGVSGEAADQYFSNIILPAPRVNAASPLGTVYESVSNVQLTYNKPISVASFTTVDIASFTGPGGVNLLPQITGIVPAATGPTSAIFTITFAAQSAIGSYSLVIEPSVLDPLGHPVDQNVDGVSNSADRYTAAFSIAVPATVGPDSFGYKAAPAPLQSLGLAGKPGTFAIINAADDASVAVNLGSNTFTLYGQQYTGGGQMFVSSNGLITFFGANAAFTNDDLSTATLPTIAVLWDDWVPSTISPQVIGLFVDDNFDNIPDRLVIEWNQVWHQPGTPSTLTFQASLALNTGMTPGAILLNYPDLDAGNTAYNNGASATVGIKSGNSPRLIASFNSAANTLVGTGKAVLFSVPTVSSIVRLGSPTTENGLVEYLVTFSEPVTGVDAADFRAFTTGSLAGAFVDHIHTTADPRVFEVEVDTGAGNGALRLDLLDNNTIVSALGAKLGGSGANNGNFLAGESYTVVQTAPRVLNTFIGDGSVQRSMIRSVTVVFDRAMTFVGDPAAAFSLAGPIGSVNLSVDLSGSSPVNTIAKLSFAGSSVVNGSLIDGNYLLTIKSNQLSAGGVALDGDNNGLAGGDGVVSFRRVFGDADGNGLVDLTDYAAFRGAYAKPSAVFDFNNSGLVDLVDFAEFKSRFGGP